MTASRSLVAAVLLALAGASTAATAHPPIAAAPSASFAQDRADILAMAGDYKVRFDIQETTRWDAAYTPLERKISGGHESVRVIEDTGRRIVLQHLLVIDGDGASHIIKHWRQDWEYEPARVLAYADRNAWRWQDVPKAMRAGHWSQTVWQVDDSPRYGGWGAFETHAGVRRWSSNPTWRPLARRDAIRKPIYDRYLATNRHQTGPDGWVHWQDNTKLAAKAGRLVPIVQESVLNTYTRFDGYDVKAADAYWAATRHYWAEVRAAWARLAAAGDGIGIDEEAETGSAISARLLELADAIAAGETATAAAATEARRLIETRARPL